MTQLCLVTVCMGRLSFLRQTLGRMATQRDCACVVVDYSCPENAGDWVEANHPQVRVLRVPGHTAINVTAARNAGARLVESPWICFIDADIVLEEHFADIVLPNLAPGRYYRAWPPGQGICGTCVVARADFARAGGYDENFRSYGDDDFDFYDALDFAGVTGARFDAALLRHLPHGDDLRTRFFEIATHGLGNLINRIYRVVKWELAQHRGAALEPDECRALYHDVSGRLSAATIRPPFPAQLMVDLAAEHLVRRGVRLTGRADAQRLVQALVKPLAKRPPS